MYSAVNAVGAIVLVSQERSSASICIRSQTMGMEHHTLQYFSMRSLAARQDLLVRHFLTNVNNIIGGICQIVSKHLVMCNKSTILPKAHPHCSQGAPHLHPTHPNLSRHQLLTVCNPTKLLPRNTNTFHPKIFSSAKGMQLQADAEVILLLKDPPS